MESKHMNIASHISQLVDIHIPSGTTQKAKQKYLSYFMRILGSRLQSTNFEDPDHVKNLVTRKLIAAKSSKYGTKNSDALKFEQLYNKLTQKSKSGTTSKTDKVNMLYVLYKISNIEQDSNNSSDLFHTIVSNVNYKDENGDDMDVDQPQKGSESRAGQYQFLKSFRYRSKDISEEAL